MQGTMTQALSGAGIVVTVEAVGEVTVRTEVATTAAPSAPAIVSGVIAMTVSDADGLVEQAGAEAAVAQAIAQDLGLASANLVIEATKRGLHVHQMIGIDPEAMRAAFSIPAEAKALTGLAIGYVDTSPSADAAHRERDRKPRTRRPIDEFVFSGRFGESSGV